MRDLTRGGIILQAIDAAVEPMKLLMAAVGLLLTLLISLLLFFVSNIVDSMTPDFSPTAWLLRIVSVLTFWGMSALLLGAITRMNYSEFTSGSSTRWQAAVKYSLSHWAANIFGPFFIGVGVAIILGLEAIIFGFARIPFLGELIFGLVFLPAVLLNVLLFVVLVFGTIMLYPAIAIDGYGLASAPPRVISLVRHHMGSIVATMLLTVAIALATIVVIVALVSATMALTAAISSLGMGGDKTAEILGPEFAALSSGPQGLLLSFFAAFAAQASAPTVVLARLVVSLAILVLFAAVSAFPATFILATACSMYLSYDTTTEPSTDQRELEPRRATGSSSQDLPARETVAAPSRPPQSPEVQEPKGQTSPGDWLAPPS